jgi:hypothetical protein
VLAEDPLDGDRVRAGPLQPAQQLPLDLEQPQGHRGLGRRPDHPDVDQVQPPAGRALDHADTAPGQPRIDT